MLSGASFADLDRGDEQNTAWHFWLELPWETRLTWAARAGAVGSGGARLLSELLRAGPVDEPRLLDVAERVGVEGMELHCSFALASMAGDRSLPIPFAFAVAERLRLTELLERVAARAFDLAPELVPRLDDGFLRVGSFGVRLDDTTAFRPRLPLQQRLDDADARAAVAAVALHRLDARTLSGGAGWNLARPSRSKRSSPSVGSSGSQPSPSPTSSCGGRWRSRSARWADSLTARSPCRPAWR